MFESGAREFNILHHANVDRVWELREKCLHLQVSPSLFIYAVTFLKIWNPYVDTNDLFTFLFIQFWLEIESEPVAVLAQTILITI